MSAHISLNKDIYFILLLYVIVILPKPATVTVPILILPLLNRLSLYPTSFHLLYGIQL